MYIANACIQFSTMTCHPWKWLKILIYYTLTPVGKLTREGTCFQDCQSEWLDIQLWKVTFCFLLSLSCTDHIDQSWKLQTEKKLNECSVFHCVLWLHTNNFLGFFCYCNSFVMAADRLLIICNTVVTCIIHLHSTLKIMCILAGWVLFRKIKRCTKTYTHKDKCSR